MNDVCGDNRFEIIERAKKRLCTATNIEDSPTEWAVIDSFLFRMWQMGWLPGCERAERTCTRGDEFWECSSCGMHGLRDFWNYCPNCGSRVVGD